MSAIRRHHRIISTWGGVVLLAAAAVYFVLHLWPEWQPALERFWRKSGSQASYPSLVTSFLLLLAGYYFAPCAWKRILEALKVPAIDRGQLRRNWFTTQMGAYVPGKVWMVVGRVSFLGNNGISSVKAITALILENIYMMVALSLLALIALPFLSLADVPLAIIVTLWISAGLAVLMLFAPGIQKRLAHAFSRRLGTDVEDLPHISHRNQFGFVGCHLLSWGLRGLALYTWFIGFGVPASDPPFAMMAVCILAAPASWLVALVMVFIPGGIGVRESVRGLLVSGFVVGGMKVATTIALGQRIVVVLVESIFAVQAVIHDFLQRRFPVHMNHLKQLVHLLWSVGTAYLARLGVVNAPPPINVTFSVTMRCQSRCKTCFIWKHQDREEMDLDSIERMFRSIGWTYFFNVSGGEPFLRDDLPEIVGLACRHMRPAVVHIPTNALTPELIERLTERTLQVMEREAPGTVLTIKPSMDGVGEMHDEIRGVPGNFDKLLETLERLKRLRERYHYLQVGVGTVISRYNADRLQEIIDYARDLDVDTYINEIAEEREEFFNLGTGITPDGSSYGRIMEMFKSTVRRKLREMPLLGRITTAFRVVYYDLVVRILEEKRQVIPCYAGILNVHINADGSIWPCAMLAYKRDMGRVGVDADFREIWHSETSRSIRRSIRSGECACPLANQAYSNILLHPPSLLKAIWIAIRGK
jgi:MoaA/NifB/PqqE/SkfB family radical SAM enzyme